MHLLNRSEILYSSVAIATNYKNKKFTYKDLRISKMKKVLAVCVAMMSLPAVADVTLYGQIKGGINVMKGEDSGTITQMEDYKSRIGSRGNEDLGNGLQAIWQVEQFTPMTGAQQSTGWNTRDTFIGLKGDNFGTLRAGYISDVMNDATEQKLLVDPWEWGYNAKTARGLGNITRVDKRLQGVRYDSPKFGGFKFNLHHQLADKATESDFEAASTVTQASIVSASYAHSGFEVHGVYGLYKQQNIDKTGDLDDGQLARVIGAYRANGVVAALTYQYTDGFRGLWASPLNTTVQDPQKRIHDAVKTHEVSSLFSYKMGNVTPRITYTHGFDEKREGYGKIDNTNYDQVVIGADYALSKRTTVLASAGWKNAPVAYATDVNGKVTGVDEDVYGIGIGLRHMF